MQDRTNVVELAAYRDPARTPGALDDIIRRVRELAPVADDHDQPEWISVADEEIGRQVAELAGMLELRRFQQMVRDANDQRRARREQGR